MKEPAPGPPARTPSRQLEQFDRAFEAEMDEILIQPDWFDKWEEQFKGEIGGRAVRGDGEPGHGQAAGTGGTTVNWTVTFCAGKRLQKCKAEADEVVGTVRGGIPRFNRQARHVGRLRHLHQQFNGGSDLSGGTGAVGGSQLLQHQGARYQPLGR